MTNYDKRTNGGHVRLHFFSERKGGATRVKWSLHNSDGLVYARSTESYANDRSARRAVARAARLMRDVVDMWTKNGSLA